MATAPAEREAEGEPSAAIPAGVSKVLEAIPQSATIGSPIFPHSPVAHLKGRMHESRATAEAFKPHHRRHKSVELSGSRGEEESQISSLGTSQALGHNVARSAGTSPRPLSTARWPGSTPVEAIEVKTPGSPTSPTSRLRQAGMQRRLEEARADPGEHSDASTASSEPVSEVGGVSRGGHERELEASTSTQLHGGEVLGASVVAAHTFQVDPEHGPEPVSPHTEGAGKAGTEQLRSEAATSRAARPTTVWALASQDLEYAAITAAEARAFSFGTGTHAKLAEIKPSEAAATEDMAVEVSSGIPAMSAGAKPAIAPSPGLEPFIPGGKRAKEQFEEGADGMVELDSPVARQAMPLLSPEVRRIQVHFGNARSGQ